MLSSSNKNPFRSEVKLPANSVPHDEEEIPSAPEVPIRTSSSDTKRKSPKSVWQLSCHSLSKTACQKEPFRCNYDESKRICNPVRTEWGEKYSVQWFGSRQLWRTKIVNLLEQTTDGCDLSFAKNIKVFTGKQSASQSIIIAGTIEPTAIDKTRSPDNNVIFKVTYEPRSPLDNSLQVEIAIYRNIITNLVNNRNTPHVTSYLGFQKCTASLKIPADQSKHYYDQLKSIKEDTDESGFILDLYDTTKANLLITERSSGKELFKWLNMETTLRDLLSIIFQVLYTLNCFARIGLQHNDLHYNNIFIEDMGQPITLFYKRNPTEYVELTTRYIAKIYDWDRGSILHPAVPMNLELTGSYCGAYGTCEYYNPKFDYFQFIAFLHQDVLNELVDPSIKPIVKNWFIKLVDWKWYSKLYDRAITHKLGYLEHPTDAELKPVREALRLFVDHKWDDSPFTIRNGSGSDLLPEIFFHPPDELTRTLDMWYPTSESTHQNRIIDETEYEEYEPETTPIFKVWEDELKIDGHHLTEYSGKLAKEISAKIGREFTSDEGDVYSQACWWLCFYRFHRLNISEQKAVVNSPIISDTIDNIWNMFNNRLPIAIPRYTMR
jgi:hypothetical protein